MDLLMRENAPLSAEQWEALDKVVVETARKYLVGRRFVPLFGPLGTGLPVAPLSAGGVETLVKLCELSQDFTLSWKSLELAERLGIPVDLSAAALAASQVAALEDGLVFGGCGDCGFPGLLNAPGAQEVKGGTAANPGDLLATVVQGVEALGGSGFPGPYVVVVSPGAYAQAHRPVGSGQRLEVELLREVAKAGVFAAAALNAKQALVVEAGAQNMDLAVGADLKVAYLGNDGLDHLFRVFETAALRIKRPQAIALIGG